MGTPRTHRMHASLMFDQNNTDILPCVLIPDLHTPGAVFFQFRNSQHGLEITGLRAPVGMVHADLAAIHHVAAKIASHQEAGPSGSAG